MNEFWQKMKIKAGETKDKRLLKYFLTIFLIAVFIFNWKFISFFLNYNVIGQGVEYIGEKTNPENVLPVLKYNPLEQYQQIDIEGVENNLEGDNQVAENPVVQQVIEKPIDYSYLTSQHYIEIPKLGVKAPIMFTTSTSYNTFAALLKKGVLHYPGSSLPGDEGATVVLGHSSSPSWPKVNYDWIFNRLDELSQGDEIVIDFNGQKYQYEVMANQVLPRGGELHPDLTNSRNMLVLITCWPPGGNKQRFVVEAVQK